MRGLLKTIRYCDCCGLDITYTTRRNYCSTYCSKQDSYQNRKTDYKYRLAKLYSMAKNRAEKSDLPFDIDLNYLVELWDLNEGKCCLTGLPFQLDNSEKGKTNPETVSIDKIIPKLGYTKGNVRLVCYQINIALSEYGEEQLERMCKAYVAYR